MELTGTFQILDWQESVKKQFESGAKLSGAVVKQEYIGGIIGTGEVHYQMHYSEDGNATFNGYEFVTCTIRSESCELVLKHDGKFENGIAVSEFIVIGSVGNEALKGKTGSFNAKEGGIAEYKID